VTIGRLYLVPCLIVLILVGLHVVVQKVVVAPAVLVPHRLEIGGKAFIQPAMCPRSRGNKVAKPLVRKFVGLQRVTRRRRFPTARRESSSRFACSRDVSFRPKVVHHRLGVFLVWILHTGLF